MKIKLITLLLTTSTFISLPSTATQVDEWDNRVSFLLGYKNLKSSAFEEDAQKATGIELDIKRKNWPVSIAIDLLGSGESTSVHNGKVQEVTGGVHIGARKHWMLTDNIETYIGGGVNYEIAEIKNTINGVSSKIDDNRVGVWFSAGMNWKFNNGFILGGELRHTNEIDYYNNGTIQTGGLYSGVTLGYSF